MKTSHQSIILAALLISWGCSESSTPEDASSLTNSNGGTSAVGPATASSTDGSTLGSGTSMSAVSGVTTTATNGTTSTDGVATTGSGGATTSSTTGAGGGTVTTGAGATGGVGGASASATTGMGGTGVTSPDVTVQLGMPLQEMAGFGINNNWMPALTDAEADLLFGTGEGQLGLAILRIGMAPDGNPYNGSNLWSDMEKASARGVETFIGTLWSPPAHMKSNNSITGGGRLLPEYYDEWSDTIAAFPGLVKQNTGIDLYAMSPQNETDFASCGTSEPCNGNYDTTVFTGQEYADFAAVVGPKLHALNPPVKMISPEASEWIHVWSNESGCCSVPSELGSSDPLDCGFPATNCSNYDGYDYGHALYNHPTAWQYVDILGTHQYDTQVAEPWPTDVPDKKPVWQTEMSGVKWWPEGTPSTTIENGVAVAGWIHNALTVGEASAWLWWWFKALGDTNEGLRLADGTVAKRQWTLGNYSRFVRPGYTRVEITGDIPTDLLLTAFSGPEGTVVVVAINQGAAADVPITIAGGTTPASMSSWVTSATDDLAAKDAVAVTGGVFTASLPATSVTTFVGQ